ncbi:hypothetical protein AJ80_08676 [Polytolypa hystricis UAMH7299]|uniref:Uncharacterized protein n=1 Tax=Polytolypa hystricis (strain UAMH7299) TaxID=1447883 RepID=A0A2B7X430_POLH7|nr:hypothetical protein AJ80_08676 [Polytolypa hystricis UAMH7299]
MAIEVDGGRDQWRTRWIAVEVDGGRDQWRSRWMVIGMDGGRSGWRARRIAVEGKEWMAVEKKNQEDAKIVSLKAWTDSPRSSRSFLIGTEMTASAALVPSSFKQQLQMDHYADS